MRSRIKTLPALVFAGEARALRSSLAQVGELFGGKTHSTVIYACQKLQQAMKSDAALAAAVQQLCARLKQ